MSNASSAPSLQSLLAGAQLPALPQSAIRLMQVSQDPENGPAEYAVPIEADPGLTGQILRFVNSSYFGFSREISSVRLAITLVGIRTIKNFVLWSAVFSLIPNPKCGPFDLKKMWQDSLRRGLFARAVGKALGLKDTEDLFAAALLQEMAIPLLAQELPGKYETLLQARSGGVARLSVLEQETFGWTHADAAGVIARGWSLPEDLAILIENHTKLDEMLAQNTPDSARLAVGLSSLLPAVHDGQWPERGQFETAYRRIMAENGPAPEELLKTIDEEFTEFAPLLNLATPAVSLSASWADQSPVAV